MQITLDKKIQTSSRLFLLDGVRGFALVNMILYHTLYDVVYIFGHPIGWYQSQIGYLWQQSICWCFILLSGFCFSLGKRPIRRGGLIFIMGCAVSLVTAIAMPEQRVRFGILSLIGCSMILTGLCSNLLGKINPFVGLGLSFGVFLLTKTVPIGAIGFADTPILSLPKMLYQTGWLYPLGFPRWDFFSSDYFSIIPWLFLYWTGYFIAKAVGDCQRFDCLKHSIPVLGWIGKHSLWIYLVHQPVVYAVLILLHQFKLV